MIPIFGRRSGGHSFLRPADPQRSNCDNLQGNIGS
jgi:hypothetical protein